MNQALRRAVSELAIGETENGPLRLAFTLTCALRVRHLLEDIRVIELLDEAQERGRLGNWDEATWRAAAAQAAQLARSHPGQCGTQSLDGSGHAAVSATNAVAMALAGRVVDTAEYAAYASVYSYGGYAVSDPRSFEDEYRWQVAELTRLAHGALST